MNINWNPHENKPSGFVLCDSVIVLASVKKSLIISLATNAYLVLQTTTALLLDVYLTPARIQMIITDNNLARMARALNTSAFRLVALFIFDEIGRRFATK